MFSSIRYQRAVFVSCTVLTPVSYTHLDVYKRQLGGKRPFPNYYVDLVRYSYITL